MAEHAQGRQGAVAGAAARFCPPFAPRRVVHVRSGVGTGRLQGWATLGAPSGGLFGGGTGRMGPFLPARSCSAFRLFLWRSLLEGAVEVDTDAIAGDPGVLVG